MPCYVQYTVLMHVPQPNVDLLQELLLDHDATCHITYNTIRNIACCVTCRFLIMHCYNVALLNALLNDVLLQELSLDHEAVLAEAQLQLGGLAPTGETADVHHQAAGKPHEGRSAAQADANMAALLQEEAGYAIQSSVSMSNSNLPSQCVQV